MHDVLPPHHPSDSDDVLWALDTAKALFQRGDREGARQWLRRAAVTARNDGRLERAVELQRVAAELPGSALGPSLSIPPTDFGPSSSVSIPPIDLGPELANAGAPPPIPTAPAAPPATTSWDAELARMFAGFDAPVVVQLRRRMTLWELRRDEEMPVPALLHVLAGAVSAAPRLSDDWSKNINAGNFFQGVGRHLAIVDGRIVGRAPLSVVATFSEDATCLIADYSPGFAEDLRRQADATGLRLAVAGGELGERLDAALIDAVVSASAVQSYAAHAVVASVGARSMGLCIVVEGGLELLGSDGFVKGQVRAGQALFPESALTGAAFECTVRAAGLGAVVLCASEQATSELMATQPLLIEALMA